MLTDLRKRFGVLVDRTEAVQVEALRHEGGECVVREQGKETTFAVENHCVLPMPGTPVICRGIKSASHLNGKIGDAGILNADFRLPVHFEDKHLKPTLVKARESSHFV